MRIVLCSSQDTYANGHNMIICRFFTALANTHSLPEVNRLTHYLNYYAELIPSVLHTVFRWTVKYHGKLMVTLLET